MKTKSQISETRFYLFGGGSNNSSQILREGAGQGRQAKIKLNLRRSMHRLPDNLFTNPTPFIIITESISANWIVHEAKSQMLTPSSPSRERESFFFSKVNTNQQEKTWNFLQIEWSVGRSVGGSFSSSSSWLSLSSSSSSSFYYQRAETLTYISKRKKKFTARSLTYSYMMMLMTAWRFSDRNSKKRDLNASKKEKIIIKSSVKIRVQDSEFSDERRTNGRLDYGTYLSILGEISFAGRPSRFHHY